MLRESNTPQFLWFALYQILRTPNNKKKVHDQADFGSRMGGLGSLEKTVIGREAI